MFTVVSFRTSASLLSTPKATTSIVESAIIAEFPEFLTMLTSMPCPDRLDADTTFVSVAVVCGRHPLVMGMPHIIDAINDYLGVHPSWSFEMASAEGYPRLMKIMLARGGEPKVDMRYVAFVCNQGIDEAAASGRLSVLEDFVRCFPGLVITDAVYAAAQHGQLHVLDWLDTQRSRVRWTSNVLDQAVYYGHTSVVRLLCNRFAMEPTYQMLNTAVTRDYADMAEWLWLATEAWENTEVAELAISKAMLPLAKTLWSKLPSLRINIDVAAGRGDMEFILWATARGAATATTRAMDRAAANGHLDVLVWLAANRTEGCTVAAMNMAALGGHLSVLEWIQEQVQLDACFTAEALVNAATHGHLDVLIWLDRHRGAVDFPDGSFDHAAARGCLDVVMWMTAAGVGHPTHRALDYAAENGHLEVVIWLSSYRTEGCTTDAMDLAASNGHFDVLQWLAEHRHEGCTTAAMDEAALIGRLDIVQWLSENRQEGCTTNAMAYAARCGSLEIIQYLHDNRTEGCTVAAMNAAIERANIPLVKWFRENRDEGCSSRGMDAAVKEGEFAMLEYLRLEGIAPDPGCTPRAFVDAVHGDELYLASWVDYHYHHRITCGDMGSIYRMNGWTPTILQAVFE